MVPTTHQLSKALVFEFDQGFPDLTEGFRPVVDVDVATAYHRDDG
jgi:hypothetical protein